MSDQLAIIEHGESALTLAREPIVVLEEAHRAAASLKQVIEAKADKVIFGGEQYLEFEDWSLLGRFYGVAPRVPDGGTKFVSYGDATGWEAYAEAVHLPTGRVISSATSMCMNDEEKWRARPKYAWVYHKKSGGYSVEDPGKDELIWEQGNDGKRRPKKERMNIGEEVVPLFQLRSMAQTRAQAKALRNCLSWVVVLAGYRPTPAEEMPDYGGAPAARTELTVAPSNAGPNVEDAEVLFPTPAEESRDALLASIKAIQDRVGMKMKDRTEWWEKYVGGGTIDPRSVDVSVLQDLYAALKGQYGE